MVVIGHDTAGRLDVIPAQLRVLVTHRPKLACRSCPGTVVQAAAPARLIEGGLPTEALVAHVLVARDADHLPLDRQAQMMARQGLHLDRSTLAFWVGFAAAEIAPVVARLREILLASARLFADETTVPVLDPGLGLSLTVLRISYVGNPRAEVGGDPSQNTVIEPFVRMGPLPRNPAAEAHGCFMVRTPSGFNRVRARLGEVGRTG